jgi:hypothetical protein
MSIYIQIQSSFLGIKVILTVLFREAGGMTTSRFNEGPTQLTSSRNQKPTIYGWILDA